MKKGFTLIELLIVIAIIAILAMIAVPNFLEAQVRAKVSRVHADERTIAVAVEAYAIDWGRPPFGGNEGKNIFNWTEHERDLVYVVMTTPVAYISSPPADPFIDKTQAINPDQGGAIKYQKFYTYQYLGYKDTGSFREAYNRGFTYYIRSPGPARLVGLPYFAAMTDPEKNYGGENGKLPLGMVYDSTNGTLSAGNLYRTNRGYFSGPNG